MDIIVKGARLEAIPGLKDSIVKIIHTLLDDDPNKGPLHSLGISLGHLPAVKADFQRIQRADHPWPMLLNQLLAQAITMLNQSSNVIALNARDVQIIINFNEEEMEVAARLQQGSPIQMTRHDTGSSHFLGSMPAAMTP